MITLGRVLMAFAIPMPIILVGRVRSLWGRPRRADRGGAGEGAEMSDEDDGDTVDPALWPVLCRILGAAPDVSEPEDDDPEPVC